MYESAYFYQLSAQETTDLCLWQLVSLAASYLQCISYHRICVKY